MSALQSSIRPLRLLPWVVRAVVPPAQIGTYALHRDGTVIYVGRSHDLRRRLIEHADANRADFFTFDVHDTPLEAFKIESAFYHALKDTITNHIHPAAVPGQSGVACPFCRVITLAILTQRIDIQNVDRSGTETSRPRNERNTQ